MQKKILDKVKARTRKNLPKHNFINKMFFFFQNEIFEKFLSIRKSRTKNKIIHKKHLFKF